MKNFLLCIFFLSAGTAEILSQTTKRPVAAIYTGLGAYSNYQSDIFSFGSNQASLARVKQPAAGMYGEKRFLLDELGLYKLSVAVPTHSGNFGIQTNYFGFSDYNETNAGLAYARNLGEKLEIGVQFNYNSIKIAGYGNASAVNVEIGGILHLTEKLNAGVHVFNPVGGKFNKGDNEELASVYTFGFGYDFSEIFFLSAEIEKEENKPINVNAGMQYKIVSKLAARAGISTSTSAYYFGIGLYLKSFRFDVISSYQQPLGFTPGLMIQYNFSSSSEKSN